MTEAPFTIDTPTGPIAGFAGAEAGPDLLLLHGGPGLTDYMDMLAGETAGWRTIRYQQRGLAPSTTDGPFTVAQHVADAIAVLDGLRVARTVVLGSSWGAHLALQLALARPDRVTTVIHVDGLGPEDDGRATEMSGEQHQRLPPQAQERLARLEQRLGEPGASDDDLLAAFRLLWAGYFADPREAPPAPETMRFSLEANGSTLGSMFAELADGAFAGRLTRLTVPTVVMVGAASPIPNGAGERIAELVPDARLVRVEGAGHLVWVEQPGCVAAVLAGVTR